MLMSVIAHGDWADHADQMRDFLGAPTETHIEKHHAEQQLWANRAERNSFLSGFVWPIRKVTPFRHLFAYPNAGAL